MGWEQLEREAWGWVAAYRVSQQRDKHGHLWGSSGLWACPESRSALGCLNWTLRVERVGDPYGPVGRVGAVSGVVEPGCVEKAPGHVARPEGEK